MLLLNLCSFLSLILIARTEAFACGAMLIITTEAD